jgi:nucleoside-diphosphate-sugar epimerase
MHLFSFGLGYSATALARRLAADGWRITGTSTSEAGARRIAAAGFDGLVFDGRAPSPAVSRALADATHVLLSIPPGPDGDPAFVHHRADIASAPRLGWIGYLSTIAVYGDQQGGWVDERTPPNPMSERGRRRLAAENSWLTLGAETGKATMVFRLPGIYGPGRSALDDIADGTARRLVKKDQVFNRIHVDDIAGAVLAAMTRPRSGAIFNVTDDEPAPPQDVVAYAASLAGRAPPPETPFETADITPMARSFYSENKRVRNGLLKAELGYVLAYPTYREGLSAIAAATG